MKQISLETKLKIVNYKDPNKYDHLLENKVIDQSNLLFSSNLGLLTNPSNYVSAAIEIERTKLSFSSITNNFKYNFIELFSNDLFHLKLNNCYVITTKKFSYFNFEEDIHIELANGTLKLNKNINNSLQLLNTSKDIQINYFLGFFENNQYLNLNWNNQNA